ncbi:MAG TPA: cytidine deaminase [Gemmatimonadaceae bacterium]|nr:cytidine deaminase [Gemmatimonadaceae bacterium]
MADLTESQRALFALAREARSRAYAPYSRFAVGAALRTRDGQIFTGCNVENASFGLTMCAERIALFTAVSTIGHEALSVEAIAVDAGPGRAASPCGACRQVLAELAPEALVIWFDGTAPRLSGAGALLPESFHL